MLMELTSEQEAMITEVCEERLAHALSCEPADREQAERAVDDAYRAAGLEPPELHFWLSSPYEGAIANMTLSGLGKPVRRTIHEQVLRQVEGQVAKQVSLEVIDQVTAQIANQIWHRLMHPFIGTIIDQCGGGVGSQIWRQTLEQTRNQTLGHVENTFRNQNWSIKNDCIAGQHSAYQLAHIEIFRRLGVQNIEIADALCGVGRSSGWWWPLEDAVILTDRPEQLHLDQGKRLHCETGPALQYRDGFSIYSWHGFVVPIDLIEHGWDVERILNEPNADLSRCAIELMGWEQFIASANLTQVGSSVPDPGNPGHEITLFDLPKKVFNRNVRVLLSKNYLTESESTQRSLGLTVPADMSNPIAAAAWTYNTDPEEYKQSSPGASKSKDGKQC